jgi:hypothetical protein
MKALQVIASIVISIGVLSSTVVSQQKTESEKAKLAAASLALSQPGPEHKQLEAMVGMWDDEIKVWFAPGKPPMKFKGTRQNRMVLGGRFLLSESKSGEAEMTIETMSIIGFDRRHKKFTTVGYDTMGTYYVTGAGPYDESRKAIVMYGEDVDPALGTQKYDMVLRIISPTSYVTEVIFKDPAHTQGQKEFKMVEITHTKK